MRVNSKWRATTLVALGIALGSAMGAADRAQTSSSPAPPELLPRERELASALSGGPASFAEQAGVYVLEAGGYVKLRESRNGFTCIVNRSSPQTFEPECYDAEGTATSLLPVLYRAELRAQGKREQEIDQAIAEGYASGRFRAPRRPGVIYMLSKENRVVADPATGRIISTLPHVMFHAPYLTNADVGAAPDSPVFVINEGGPGALMIVFPQALKGEVKNSARN